MYRELNPLPQKATFLWYKEVIFFPLHLEPVLFDKPSNGGFDSQQSRSYETQGQNVDMVAFFSFLPLLLPSEGEGGSNTFLYSIAL